MVLNTSYGGTKRSIECKLPSDEPPPCKQACPIGIDIPRYIRLIGEGKFAEALAVILEKLPFPSICGHICPRPCETACHLNKIEGAVAVNALKRFVVEKALVSIKDKVTAKSSGKRIAIIGSGPAGLTVAYYLSKLGHTVTVFEAAEKAGGLLRTGIPRYHLPEDILDREIERVSSLGVEFRLNTHIEKIHDLFKIGYHAIFLGIGLTQGRVLPIPGTDLDGVIVSTSFLEDINLGKRVKGGKKVLVLGGGGVSCDVARTALRLGAAEVHIACLESWGNMPALPWEIGETIREGVIIHPSRSFIRILGNNNCVTGVECIKLKWAKFDEEGGLHLEPIKGSEHVLQADTVIFGIGQVPDLSLVSDVREIKIAKRGTIIVDPKTLATGYPHVFAGGDVVEGPAWVINAIAAGRKAAISIDKDLGGRGVIEQTLGPPELTVASLPSSLPVGERGPMPSLPVPERLNSFAEVEVGLTEEMAMKEASRCLRCDLPITIDSAKCTGCRICEFRCSFSHENVFNLSMSRVKVRRLIKAENEYSISITDQCDDCGICARYCPYEALIRERREYEV